jgi:hypothetical protein
MLVRGEQRVTTHELLTVHLGIPVTDRACRRLRRVMHELGWRGPRKMRWGKKTMHSYWRLPTVRLPAIVQAKPILEASATIEGGTLAAELETVTRKGLKKLDQILELPTDPNDGNVLRAQTTAAGIAVNAQLRTDEIRLRQKVQGDVLERLLGLIEKKRGEVDRLEREKEPDGHR